MSLSSEDKFGLIMGSVLLVSAGSLMVYRGCGGAKPWTPKLRWHSTEVIRECVQGHSVEDVMAWAEYSPCQFEFFVSDDCSMAQHSIVIGDPESISDGSGAVTQYSVPDPIGQLSVPDTGTGKPGLVGVGVVTWTRITAMNGLSPKVGGHELNHTCGYDHTWQDYDSNIYMNLHVNSPKTKTIGGDMRGLELDAHEWDERIKELKWYTSY